MSGHFSAFKNREKISEAKKFYRRDTLGTKKSNLIEFGSFANEGNKNLPSLSNKELEKIKNEIEERIGSSKKKSNLLFAISFFIIIIVLFLISKKYNVF